MKNEIEIWLEILIEKKLYIKKIKQNLFFREKKILKFFININTLKGSKKIFNKVKEIAEEKIIPITNLVIIGCSRVLRV